MVRYDALMAPEWMYSKFDKTDEGYLKGKAVICTTGVYEYRHGDGSVIKELRLPEEVFAPEFLDSLKLKPLTLDHPMEMVNSENVKNYQIGTLGEQIDSDNYHVAIDMIIHDAKAIKAVHAGKQALSVGYTCDLEPAEPGARWCGQDYDYIQRNIRANHTSLVSQGRAGDSARIRLDSADAVLVHPTVEKTKIDEGGNMPELKIIKLDGVEYQAELDVIKAYKGAIVKVDELTTTLTKATAKMDALTDEKTKLEAARDTQKDRANAAEAKVKELEALKMDEATIATAVARRVRILDTAHRAGVEVAKGTSELDVQKAVIVKVFPKAVLADRDDKYIDARFDGAVEMLDAEEKGDAENRKPSAPEHTDGKETVIITDSTKAREKMITDLKARYLGNKKEK